MTTQSGALRIVGSLANCDPATESALSWNQQGVAGAPGPPGPAGASISGSAALPGNVAARLKRTLAAIHTKLAGDELGDLSTQSQLKLQMSMDRVSKFYETLSNLLKKLDQTQQELVENLR